MNDKLTICLLGPKNGGKSTLLATLTDCIAQQVHGYPADLQAALQAITKDEFGQASGTNGLLPFLGVQGGQYDKLRAEFADGVSATDSQNTYEYFFRLELNGEHPHIGDERLPIYLQIVDAAGEIAIPEGTTTVSDEVKHKLFTQILDAQALVFVVPLVNLEDIGWIHPMARLIDAIAHNSSKKLRRLVVAFSQYERLFVRLGESAFTYACDPRVALHVVRRALQATPWLGRGLRSLENNRKGDVSVRFTVISAFGFTKKFRNPNIDPHVAGRDKRFRRTGTQTPNRAANELWRPFLTAEPILYAALNQDSEFTFSYRQIGGVGPPPPPPPPPPRPPSEPRWWWLYQLLRRLGRAIRDELDVNRRS